MAKLRLTPVQTFKLVTARKALAEILEEIKTTKLTGTGQLAQLHLQASDDSLAEFMALATPKPAAKPPGSNLRH